MRLQDLGHLINAYVDQELLVVLAATIDGQPATLHLTAAAFGQADLELFARVVGEPPTEVIFSVSDTDALLAALGGASPCSVAHAEDRDGTA